MTILFKNGEELYVEDIEAAETWAETLNTEIEEVI